MFLKAKQKSKEISGRKKELLGFFPDIVQTILLDYMDCALLLVASNELLGVSTLAIHLACQRRYALHFPEQYNKITLDTEQKLGSWQKALRAVDRLAYTNVLLDVPESGVMMRDACRRLKDGDMTALLVFMKALKEGLQSPSPSARFDPRSLFTALGSLKDSLAISQFEFGVGDFNGEDAEELRTPRGLHF